MLLGTESDSVRSTSKCEDESYEKGQYVVSSPGKTRSIGEHQAVQTMSKMSVVNGEKIVLTMLQQNVETLARFRD